MSASQNRRKAAQDAKTEPKQSVEELKQLLDQANTELEYHRENVAVLSKLVQEDNQERVQLRMMVASLQGKLAKYEPPAPA